MSTQKVIHGFPSLDPNMALPSVRTGDIAFERTADQSADCTELLTWTIVEFDGKEWKRAGRAAKEKLRRYIREKFELDATYTDALITALMYALLKLHEHEDGDHGRWIVE